MDEALNLYPFFVKHLTQLYKNTPGGFTIITTSVIISWNKRVIVLK